MRSLLRRCGPLAALLLVAVAAGCDILDEAWGDAGVAVLTSRGDVVTFTADGSSAAWDASVGGGDDGALLADGGVLYVASGTSTVRALDGEDGGELWAEDVGGSTRGRLVLAGDVLVGQTADAVFALDTADGSELWSRSYTGLSVALAEGDGALFAAGDPVRRLSAATGEEEGTFSVGDSFVPDILFAGGTLMVGGRDAVFAVGPGSMEEEWNHPLSGTYTSGMVADGSDVYVATDADGLLGFDASSATPFLEALPGEPLDPPATAGGMVYVTIPFGDLICIDPVDGSEVWSWAASGDHRGGVVVAGSSIYLADGDALVGLDVDGGTVEWEQSPGGTLLDIELL